MFLATPQTVALMISGTALAVAAAEASVIAYDARRYTLVARIALREGRRSLAARIWEDIQRGRRAKAIRLLMPRDILDQLQKEFGDNATPKA